MGVSRKTFIKTLALGSVAAGTSSFTVLSGNNPAKLQESQLTVGLASSP